MKIGVHGLWHLGTVTSACLAAAGFRTIGLAEGPDEADRLSRGEPPLYEPALGESLSAGLDGGTLSFSADPAVLADCDLVWVTFDTPVNEDDVADVQWVLSRIEAVFPHLRDGAVVLISSQLPVGSTKALHAAFDQLSNGRHVSFAYSPENLRLGQAIDVFNHPERIIVGYTDDGARELLQKILSRFCESIVWMDVQSAEMVKHSLNTWLAASVVLTNEMAAICERVGGDFQAVEQALRLDPRVGQRAYVRPGAAFGGGTLARDVRFLEDLARGTGVEVELIGAIRRSNAHHRDWVMRQLTERWPDLRGRKVGLLGLAYKAGTDSTRRSVAVELARSLAQRGAEVHAFDPKVTRMPSDLAGTVKVASALEDVFENADAVILATEWPEFRATPLAGLIVRMSTAFVIDQSGYLRSSFVGDEFAADYVCLGRAR